MKYIIILLLIPMFSYSQNYKSTVLEASTSFDHIALSPMFGFTNFQEDSFHAGLLYKDYGPKHRTGIRININLNLNTAMFIFIQGDIFANTEKQNNSSFLENSAGLGLRLFKGLSFNAGYQMEDYNPVTEIRSEDRLLIKLAYKFGLK